MAPVKKAPKKTTTKAAVTTVPLYDMTGEHLKDIEAPSHIFSVEASPMLLAQYVRVYLDRQKHAYGRTQTRSEVAGSTRKIYRQKGTGRARHGDIRAPIFVGGGITHGPSGVKRVLTMNKKQKVKALLTALSHGRNAGNIGVIDFTSVDSMKTKAFEPVLKKLGYVKGKPMVIVYGSKDNYEGLKNMVRNLDGVQYSMQSILNAYDCMRAKKVIFTKNAFEAFVDARTKEIKKVTTH